VTERVVLATKGRFPRGGTPNDAGLSAFHLTRALDASLRRLGRGPRGPEAAPNRQCPDRGGAETVASGPDGWRAAGAPLKP